MDFIKQQLNRRSERGLNIKKPISPEDIQTLKDVINAAPSSINGQGASAIFIQDREMIEKYSTYNFNQPHVKRAQLIILFVGDMNRVKYAHELQGNKDWELNENNFKELFTVGTVDATIKSQAVVDAALALNLGTCYLGGARIVSDKLIKDLNLPDFVFPIIGLSVGHIDEQEEIKPKLNSVFMEKYDNELMKQEVIDYDKVMKKYYDKRTGNKKDTNWSSETVKTYGYSFSGEMYDEYYKLLDAKFKTKN